MPSIAGYPVDVGVGAPTVPSRTRLHAFFHDDMGIRRRHQEFEEIAGGGTLRGGRADAGGLQDVVLHLRRRSRPRDPLTANSSPIGVMPISASPLATVSPVGRPLAIGIILSLTAAVKTGARSSPPCNAALPLRRIRDRFGVEERALEGVDRRMSDFGAPVRTITPMPERASTVQVSGTILPCSESIDLRRRGW